MLPSTFLEQFPRTQLALIISERSWAFIHCSKTPLAPRFGTRASAADPASKLAIRGAISTWIFGLNDGGDVVGSFETNAQVFHGFLLHHTGQLQIIDPPSPLIGGPFAVNNSLVVVGGDFRWQGGKFTKIDFRTPNQGEDQRLNGISNPGIIVGSLFHQDFLEWSA